MTENNNSNNKNDNTHNKKKSFIYLIISKIRTYYQKKTNSTNNPTSNETKKKWKDLDIGVRTQIILTIVTIFILIVYIIAYWNQYSQTKESLRKTDIANSYTRQSLDLADSARKQNREMIEIIKRNSESSDKLNKKTIDIADSYMKISAQISKIQKEFYCKELQAYLDITIKDFPIFPNAIVGNFIVTNYGKTPAYNVLVYGTIVPLYGYNVPPETIDFVISVQNKFHKIGYIGINEPINFPMETLINSNDFDSLLNPNK